MNQQPDQIRLVALTGEIVSAYVSNNRVQRSDLSGLISDVHQALTTAESKGSGEADKPEQARATAQEIKRSIRPDHLVSFEDGKPYKTLRRHLSIRGLTPQAYREKWGLAADYPMVSANYSKARSELARILGLGQQRRQGLAEVSPQEALKVRSLEGRRRCRQARPRPMPYSQGRILRRRWSE